VDEIVLLLLWCAMLCLVLALGAAIADRIENSRFLREINRNLPAYLKRQAD